MDQSGILESLVRLGLSGIEAQVYLTLLVESPLTGYAVAAQSNISRTRIYDVLESLVRKGFVTVGYSSVTLYSAIPYTVCLSRFKFRNQDVRETVLELLENHDDFKSNWSEIISIYKTDDIYRKLSQAILSARKTVIMKIWACDLANMNSVLLSAKKRNVSLHLIVLGHYENDTIPFFSYNNMQPENETLGRRIYASFDNTYILHGTISEAGGSFATWTSNVCFRMLINAYLIAELRIAQMYKNDYDGLCEKYGEDLDVLRQKYRLDR